MIVMVGIINDKKIKNKCENRTVCLAHLSLVVKIKNQQFKFNNYLF